MKKIHLLLSILLCCGLQLTAAQNLADVEAPKKFGQLQTNPEMTAQAQKSLPTLEEWKEVFKPASTAIYCDARNTTGREGAAGLSNPLKRYVEVGVRTCTTEDILAGKGRYPGGMRLVPDKLLPNLVMAKTKLLENVGDACGLLTMMRIQVAVQWLYFPSPWESLK